MTATLDLAQIKVRRDTAANWILANTILGAGEFGFETDTSYLKLGDGVTAWNSLAYLPSPLGARLSLPFIDNFKLGYSTIATAGGTTILTAGSVQQQYFTGTLAQTIQMALASTCTLGQYWDIVNNSTQPLTINSSGGNLIATIPAGSYAYITCILTSGTTAASWNAQIGLVPASINGSIAGITVTATAAGTTVLVASSTDQQEFTGTTTQIVTLPVVTGLLLGRTFVIPNKSTGIVTVQSSGANTVYAIPAGATAIFRCILLTGTTATSWSFDWSGASAAPTATAFTPATTYLGADVTLAAQNVFYDGPSTAALVSGAVYLVSASVNGLGVTAVDDFTAKIWDGTTVLADGSSSSSSTGDFRISFSPFLYTAGSTNALKISLADNGGSGTGKMKANPSANSSAGNHATYITVQRIS